MTATTKKAEPTAKPAAPKKAAAAKKPAAPKKAAAAKKPAAPKKALVPTVKVEAEVEIKVPTPVVKPATVGGASGYIFAIGRRKRATVQARLYSNGKGEIKVNGRPLKEYFTTELLQKAVNSPLKAVGLDDKVNIDLKAIGGGLAAQSEAARHGISRALLKLNADFRKTLKPLGYLTRDPREKERKKYGFKKARKGPQWAKR